MVLTQISHKGCNADTARHPNLSLAAIAEIQETVRSFDGYPGGRLQRIIELLGEINNRGFSNNELNTIPNGADVPDIEIDNFSFMIFKSQYFPLSEPISITTIPESSIPVCSILALSVNPNSPQPVGTTINISGSASCNTGIRAIRFKVDGVVLDEIGASDGHTTWSSGTANAGIHTITLEAAGQGDNDWSHIASKSISFSLTSNQSNGTPTNDESGQNNQIIRTCYWTPEIKIEPDFIALTNIDDFNKLSFIDKIKELSSHHFLLILPNSIAQNEFQIYLWGVLVPSDDAGILHRATLETKYDTPNTMTLGISTRLVAKIFFGLWPYPNSIGLNVDKIVLMSVNSSWSIKYNTNDSCSA